MIDLDVTSVMSVGVTPNPAQPLAALIAVTYAIEVTAHVMVGCLAESFPHNISGLGQVALTRLLVTIFTPYNFRGRCHSHQGLFYLNKRQPSCDVLKV